LAVWRAQRPLEGEELGGGVFAGGGEFVSGVKNGFVDGVGRGGVAGTDGDEFGEGEFLTGRDARIDQVEFVLFIEQALEGTLGGNVEVESAFGAGLADAFENSGVTRPKSAILRLPMRRPKNASTKAKTRAGIPNTKAAKLPKSDASIGCITLARY
jgi:hypothetical protein